MIIFIPLCFKLVCAGNLCTVICLEYFSYTNSEKEKLQRMTYDKTPPVKRLKRIISLTAREVFCVIVSNRKSHLQVYCTIMVKYYVIF